MAATGGAVKLDASAPLVNDVIPDGETVPFAVTKEGSAACCRQLLGDLEDHPNQRHLQEEFTARRDALFERMTPADRTIVAAAADKVRSAIVGAKPRVRRRKQPEPAAA